MTGLWQVSGRSELDFDELVRLDFLYLERWSVFLDLSILLKTVPAVFRCARRLVVLPRPSRLAPRVYAVKYRFLFEQMVRRELRQKYKGSALGVLWYFVNPLVLMGAYALVFSVLLKVADIPDYPLFLLIGLIVWVFFSQALLAAAPSLVQNAPLVRKVRFPRETIPASVATVQLVTFLVMLVVVLRSPLAVRGSARPGARCCCR